MQRKQPITVQVAQNVPTIVLKNYNKKVFRTAVVFWRG